MAGSARQGTPEAGTVLRHRPGQRAGARPVRVDHQRGLATAGRGRAQAGADAGLQGDQRPQVRRQGHGLGQEGRDRHPGHHDLRRDRQGDHHGRGPGRAQHALRHGEGIPGGRRVQGQQGGPRLRPAAGHRDRPEPGGREQGTAGLRGVPGGVQRPAADDAAPDENVAEPGRAGIAVPRLGRRDHRDQAVDHGPNAGQQGGRHVAGRGSEDGQEPAGDAVRRRIRQQPTHQFPA